MFKGKGILIIRGIKRKNRCLPAIEEIYKWGINNNIRVYSTYKEMNNFVYKLLNKFGIISLIEKILLLNHDYVFYLAMNSKHITTLSLASKLKKK